MVSLRRKGTSHPPVNITAPMVRPDPGLGVFFEKTDDVAEIRNVYGILVFLLIPRLRHELISPLSFPGSVDIGCYYCVRKGEHA